MGPRAAAAAALRALNGRHLALSVSYLKAGGVRLRWAVTMVERAAGETGVRRHSDVAAVRRMLERVLRKGGPAPVDRARLLAIARANNGLAATLPRRVVDLLDRVSRWTAIFLDHLLRLPGWIWAAGLAAALAVFFWRAGGLVPPGMAQTPDEDQGQAAAPPSWSEARRAWTAGDRLGALRLGRLAMLDRLERRGLGRFPGQSDRELEGVWPEGTRTDFHRFRVEYARARWARDDAALERAWRELRLLWDRAE